MRSSKEGLDGVSRPLPLWLNSEYKSLWMSTFLKYVYDMFYDGANA